MYTRIGVQITTWEYSAERPTSTQGPYLSRSFISRLSDILDKFFRALITASGVQARDLRLTNDSTEREMMHHDSTMTVLVLLRIDVSPLH
jgi:hypothetical protein